MKNKGEEQKFAQISTTQQQAGCKEGNLIKIIENRLANLIELADYNSEKEIKFK